MAWNRGCEVPIFSLPNELYAKTWCKDFTQNDTQECGFTQR